MSVIVYPGRLAPTTSRIAEYAAERDIRVGIEALNRFETHFINRHDQALALANEVGPDVGVALDVFHMNIEETSLPEAILAGEEFIGHVHFVDSNRRPAGCGHIDFSPVASALHKIAYDRYASAEAFPYPDSDAAAQQTIETFRRFFPR